MNWVHGLNLLLLLDLSAAPPGVCYHDPQRVARLISGLYAHCPRCRVDVYVAPAPLDFPGPWEPLRVMHLAPVPMSQYWLYRIIPWMDRPWEEEKVYPEVYARVREAFEKVRPYCTSCFALQYALQTLLARTSYPYEVAILFSDGVDASDVYSTRKIPVILVGDRSEASGADFRDRWDHWETVWVDGCDPGALWEAIQKILRASR